VKTELVISVCVSWSQSAGTSEIAHRFSDHHNAKNPLHTFPRN